LHNHGPKSSNHYRIFYCDRYLIFDNHSLLRFKRNSFVLRKSFILKPLRFRFLNGWLFEFYRKTLWSKSMCFNWYRPHHLIIGCRLQIESNEAGPG
jgi:hypothetical protein